MTLAFAQNPLVTLDERAQGDLSGLQGGDVRAIATGPFELDRAYLRRHALSLGISELLEEVSIAGA